MALYEKPKDGVLGMCDCCHEEVGELQRHWLILWPGSRELDLYCEGCRLELLHSLCDDFWVDGNGKVFRMPWAGKEWELDEIERRLMIDQLDDDEAIQQDEKKEN